jgi:hypothetical protein
MAHDRLMNGTIDSEDRLFEVVTTVNQGRGCSEIPGGKC